MKFFKMGMGLACASVQLLSPAVSTADSDVRLNNYLAYEQREPCQFYKQTPPSVAYNDRCVVEDKVQVKDPGQNLLPVVATYTVYFDFDSSNISQNQYNTIKQLAHEINVHHPAQITIMGHTDTSGDEMYNKRLSAQRAESVSRALTALNIPNFYLDERALGEQNLAVPTPDNTKLAENRRVVIQFRR